MKISEIKEQYRKAKSRKTYADNASVRAEREIEKLLKMTAKITNKDKKLHAETLQPIKDFINKSLF